MDEVEVFLLVVRFGFTIPLMFRVAGIRVGSDPSDKEQSGYNRMFWIILSGSSQMSLYKVKSMDDVIIYSITGLGMFIIGLGIGYTATKRYYSRRFIQVAKECESVRTIAPLIAELERES